MTRLLVSTLLLCALTLAPSARAQQHSSGSHSHSSKSASKSKIKSNKTVHVPGYYRKDGTYVAPYDRSAPGTATRSSITSSATFQPYRKNYMAEGYTPHASVTRDRNGRIKRSSAAKAAFKRQSPCPSTGKARGACPGYVVDHVAALECGGADAPSNMQWQTVAAAKEKDKTERACRQ